MRGRILAAVLMGAGAGAVAAQEPPSIDPRIAQLVASVSQERMQATIEKLAGFGTRHALSTTTDPDRGTGAAREWIRQQMATYSPRLQVSFDRYTVPPRGRISHEAELVNVMAVLPGASPRRVYVSGHFDSLALGRDSTNQGDNRDAPGANDDGSGTALLMELARTFSQSDIQFDATLVFIALTAEEMGLVGARAHAQQMKADSVRIDAVFNNDMVGNSVGGSGQKDSWTVRVFSEGPEDSPSRQIARYIGRVSPRYVPGHAIRLIAREDRFGRGGDHTAFNQVGYPAIRITESKENYGRQHTIEDVPSAVDYQYVAQNARVNAAAVASIALAPPQPVVADRRGNPLLGRQPSGYDARLRWEASPGAVGYRIFWRETWGADWQHELYVAGGDVTEYVLNDISIDDYTFGIAAVGPAGDESLVSAYVRPPRADAPVEVIRR
jgi:hypothetical protein